jgi:hypothetical protein
VREEEVVYSSTTAPIVTKSSVSIVFSMASGWVKMLPEVDPLRGIKEVANELIFYDFVSVVRACLPILFRNGFI